MKVLTNGDLVTEQILQPTPAYRDMESDRDREREGEISFSSARYRHEG